MAAGREAKAAAPIAAPASAQPVRPVSDAERAPVVIAPTTVARPTPATDAKTDAQLAKEAHKRLYLLLPSRAHMDTVKRLCKAYPGDVPVYVKLQDEGIALLLSRDSWCSTAEEMLEACRELYGDGGVVVR